MADPYPLSLSPTSIWAEKRYYVPNERDRQEQLGANPKQKDLKKLVLFHKKIYLMGGLQLCISNQQALLGRYDYNFWDSMAKFKHLLLQDSKQEFSALMEERKTIPRASLQVALDTTDAAARTIALAVVIRSCF